MNALVQRIPRYYDIPQQTVELLPSTTLAEFADALRRWSCELPQDTTNCSATTDSAIAWDAGRPKAASRAGQRGGGPNLRTGEDGACGS